MSTQTTEITHQSAAPTKRVGFSGTPHGELYALFVVFLDGNKRIRYSRDYKNAHARKKCRRDKIIALKRFFKYLKKYENRVKTFQIYDHHPGMPPKGKKVFHWEQGILEHDEITQLVF